MVRMGRNTGKLTCHFLPGEGAAQALVTALPGAGKSAGSGAAQWDTKTFPAGPPCKRLLNPVHGAESKTNSGCVFFSTKTALAGSC